MGRACVRANSYRYTATCLHVGAFMFVVHPPYLFMAPGGRMGTPSGTCERGERGRGGNEGAAGGEGKQR